MCRPRISHLRAVLVLGLCVVSTIATHLWQGTFCIMQAWGVILLASLGRWFWDWLVINIPGGLMVLLLVTCFLGQLPTPTHTLLTSCHMHWIMIIIDCYNNEIMISIVLSLILITPMTLIFVLRAYPNTLFKSCLPF